jgi:hypothetical protein
MFPLPLKRYSMPLVIALETKSAPMRTSSLLIISMAILFSCKDEDEKPSHSFKNQNLSGKIGNSSWTFSDGYADVYGLEEESQVSVDLFQEAEDGEGCCALAKGNEVLFTLPNKVGLYMLKFELNDFENSVVVNLFEEDGYVNNLASTGAVEILSISETQVSGRIDARIDDESFVNGNFTVNICK